jgi:phospholipid/cholesterol/gamma-HCH transport system substrate-binding protein
METHTEKFKIKLGIFIIIGLAIFVLAIFIIGKQKNLFNPVFKLTATFHNVSGLQVGNNIRFSGINIGIIDNIHIMNDSTVKVEMLIKKDVWQFIKSDCTVTLGSEGIIGDKLIIISQGSSEASPAIEGQSLRSIEPIETNAIIARLDATVMSTEITAHQVSQITYDINKGKGTLTRLIQDSILAENLNQTISNLNTFSNGLKGSETIISSLKETAKNAENITYQFSLTMNRINHGEGTLGHLIQDTSIAHNLNQIVLNLENGSRGLIGTDTIMSKLNVAAGNAEIISKQLTEIMSKINTGNGTIGRLIRDTVFAENLNQTLINLKKSSKGLDENMTAAKHNFLFRGYFEKKAKEAAEKKEDKIKAAKENNL